MMLQYPTRLTSIPRIAGGLRCLLVIALTASLITPAHALTSTKDTPSPISVLDLQRLVDRMLVEDHSQFDDNTATNVLDLQRALQKTIRSDSSQQQGEPARQDDVILPSPIRFHIPATPALVRSFEEHSNLNSAALASPLAEQLPSAAGTRVRYQFHLLANAPPRWGVAQIILIPTNRDLHKVTWR